MSVPGTGGHQRGVEQLRGDLKDFQWKAFFLKTSSEVSKAQITALKQKYQDITHYITEGELSTAMDKAMYKVEREYSISQGSPLSPQFSAALADLSSLVDKVVSSYNLKHPKVGAGGGAAAAAGPDQPRSSLQQLTEIQSTLKACKEQGKVTRQQFESMKKTVDNLCPHARMISSTDIGTEAWAKENSLYNPFNGMKLFFEDKEVKEMQIDPSFQIGSFRAAFESTVAAVDELVTEETKRPQSALKAKDKVEEIKRDEWVIVSPELQSLETHVKTKSHREVILSDFRSIKENADRAMGKLSDVIEKINEMEIRKGETEEQVQQKWDSLCDSVFAEIDQCRSEVEMACDLLPKSLENEKNFAQAALAVQQEIVDKMNPKEFVREKIQGVMGHSYSGLKADQIFAHLRDLFNELKFYLFR